MIYFPRDGSSKGLILLSLLGNLCFILTLYARIFFKNDLIEKYKIITANQRETIVSINERIEFQNQIIELLKDGFSNHMKQEHGVGIEWKGI